MILNFALLVLLAGFVLFGLWFGFVHTLGALAGTIIGAFAAGKLYEPLATWLSGTFGWDHNLMRVIAFLVLFVLINRLVGLLFYVVERVFRFISIIPFLSTIDHLLGLILGFLEGVLVLGLTLFVAQKFPIGPLAQMITDASVAKWMMKTASILLPLLPKVIQNAM
jgi:uncharacterized membrane protein required for colicin V production